MKRKYKTHDNDKNYQRISLHKHKHKPALAVKSLSRVFVNYGRQTQDSKNCSLKSVKPMSHDSMRNSFKFDAFVNRLDLTKPRDVAQYLKHVHGKQLKVIQVRNKYPGYVSFKVNAQSRKLMSGLSKNSTLSQERKDEHYFRCDRPISQTVFMLSIAINRAEHVCATVIIKHNYMLMCNHKIVINIMLCLLNSTGHI